MLPTPCRVKKVIELQEDIPNITTLITEEQQKSYPLRHRNTDAKTINCRKGASNNISAQIRRSNHQQDIRKSRIPIPTWRKKLRSNCQPKKLPAKPVGLVSKVTSHRTDKEMTEEKKYEIRDDDGNINFTGEHQLDDTEDINRVNTNDSDGSDQYCDQYCRITMVDNIKVNIQQAHGPTTIKLAQCFCLAV